MAILSITTDFAGQVDVAPQICRIVTTDDYSTITTAGYLDNVAKAGFSISADDIILIKYSTATGFFTVSVSNGVITLAPMVSAGEVVLPVTVNHIAAFTDTSGAIGDDPATAINGGNIQAGLSGTAGYLASFPATSAKGSLRVQGVANTGDTVTTISNVAMGQASVVSIPDPAAATANFVVAPSALVSNNLVKASGTAGLVVDAGARIIANTTGTYAGGGTSNSFTATGLTSAAKGSAVIRTSTNSVSITKALPGTNTLAITFSADPGAGTTVDYIYVTAAQS